MKIRMKSPLLLAALLAAGVTLTGAAMARGGDCADGPRGHRADRVGVKQERHGQRVGEHLDQLATSLQLRETQRPAWEQFRERFDAQGPLRAPRPADAAALSAPERMQGMEQLAAARLENLRSMREATEALYAVLDEVQRKTFDEHHRHPHAEMREHRQGKAPRHG